MLFGLIVGITAVSFGMVALNNPTNEINEPPPALGFALGAVALLSALGDARMLLARSIQWVYRIARHLWRMCFALWIAVASFFLG